MSQPMLISPDIVAADATLLTTRDPTDRRFWFCSAFGCGFSVWAPHVVDDFGNLVRVGAWR